MSEQHPTQTRCGSPYSCNPECCGEELWYCDRDKGHTGEHMNVMVWPQDPEPPFHYEEDIGQ